MLNVYWSYEDWLFVLSYYQDWDIPKKWEFMKLVKETSKEKTVADIIADWNKKSRHPIQNVNFFKSFNFSQKKEELDQWHVRWISFESKDYPELLRHIYDPPLSLFVMGDLTYLNQKSLSIVGSRRATDYGYHALRSILPELVNHDLLIISGLAKGIDSYAHQLCLREGGQTLAVVGTGLDQVYPKENYDLQVELVQKHCVVSEYPIGTGPDRSHFPMRNRIISGMSWGCFVVEAYYRSGSLITANLALNEGREVFALPGSVFSKSSRGCNDLLKHGAKCVMTAEDILEDLSTY